MSIKGSFIFLLCGCLVVDDSFSIDLTGNCSFDQRTFCGWKNEKHEDNFDWLIRSGPTPSNLTGPTSDYSGHGFYIYIESSSPRKYSERARLISPVIQGPKRLSFYYSMYGSAIETLYIYLRINGTDHRVWGRHGPHSTGAWREACVTLNLTKTYQVILEGIAGVIYTADIAVDEIIFSKNLTCSASGTNANPEVLKANCSFDKSFCGWRNADTDFKTKWLRKNTKTPSQGTGPDADHTGNGYFVHIEASSPAQYGHFAMMTSPLVHGPKCFRFYYHMYGAHIGRLEVRVRAHGQQMFNVIWSKTGNQGNLWRNASIAIGFIGEFQISIKGVVGPGWSGDIAVDDVTFFDGICDDETNQISQGNCNFDFDICLWKNDVSNDTFDWTLARDATPSSATGPSTDHTTGRGMYIYIEASYPRKPKDSARLLSPVMRGPQCMTFFYHMYGFSMGCLVIYIKKQRSNKMKALWLKSGNQENIWRKGNISINETDSYQIVVDGIRGRDYFGDAAFDDFSFQRGVCKQTERSTFYVSYKEGHFFITTRPPGHSGYTEEFRFELDHQRGNPNEVSHFVYSLSQGQRSFLTPSMDLSDYTNFPIAVVALNNVENDNSTKVYLIDRAGYQTMISLDDYRLTQCCTDKSISFFYVYNVRVPNNKANLGCAPGWFKAGGTCYLFYLQSAWKWVYARTQCHLLGAELAVVNSAEVLDIVSSQRNQLHRERDSFYVGLSGYSQWVWTDRNNTVNDLWGPSEPSGDGKCGSFLNGISWDSKWVGLGWRWNDIGCNVRLGYICEQPLAVPFPIGLFTLAGPNGTVNQSPTGSVRGESVGIGYTPGPFGSSNDSFFFNGTKKSYVRIGNSGELDARFSIGVFLWVRPQSSSGPLFKYLTPSGYGCDLWVRYPAMSISARFAGRNRKIVKRFSKKNVLQNDRWNFVGAMFDNSTGTVTVWVNDKAVIRKKMGTDMELATQRAVRLGALKRNPTSFRGGISCFQVYNQALSDDQILAIKSRCNQTSAFSCNPNFSPFHGGCFSVNTTDRVTWHQALTTCRRKGGTLAKVDREGLRYSFSNMLENMRPRPSNLHIGLKSADEWRWTDGSSFNDTLWSARFPTKSKGVESCGLLPGSAKRFINVDCESRFYPMCQKMSVSPVSNMSEAISSSYLKTYGPSLAMDGFYTTCFRSRKENNPWWQVAMTTDLYVEEVEITFVIDCCPRDLATLRVTVSSHKSGLNPSCNETVQYGKYRTNIVRCAPPGYGRYVTVTLTDNNVTLVLCHVSVKTMRSSKDAHGILREAWYDVNYDSRQSPTMRTNPAFGRPVGSRITIRDFDAPTNVGDKYIQRLSGYLQVPESGNYTFYMSCDDFCELYKHNIREIDIEGNERKGDKSSRKEPVIVVKRLSGYHQWDRYNEQQSRTMFLSRCRLYELTAYMREESTLDHLSVGMRKPNGSYERPIPASRLYWVNPGTRELEISLHRQQATVSAVVGFNISITGFFRFCCEGITCPDCPLELNITTLEQNSTLSKSLNQSCLNTSFTAVFDTNKQTGNFTIKVHFSFVKDTEAVINERTIGHLHLQAHVLEECYFSSGFCEWTSVKNQPSQWKVSAENTFNNYPGQFAYIDSPTKARLQSRLLQWRPFHQSLGICLRFRFLIPNNTMSSLKVFLKNLEQQEMLVWQAFGFHGTEWSVAQLSWSPVGETKVIFEAEGVLEGILINVAIDDVIVTTESCLLEPYFSKPGFRCTDQQFTCDNGQCVKKNLLCDGDFACTDGSDEKNCECPSNMFSCPGGRCLLATAVCDGENDCSNGEDESNCANPCESGHQCLDGTCIRWSKTCAKSLYCRDGTNTPSICGSGKCYLNDLACSSVLASTETRCRSFRGYCGFQTGLCGLQLDKNSSFHWTVGSGQTLTESTGPSYDHTSFNKEGSYIFIEASQKRPGEKARILSEWMEPNETTCLQFWYHMHGKHIGSLNVYLKTNQSETLVWNQSGDKGNRWQFGQAAFYSPNLYKIVLEATTGDGNKGDIAIDDLAVLDGNCETIHLQTSPDCYFEEGTCEWQVQEEWILDNFVEGIKKSGGFIALPARASDVPSVISSPVINQNGYEWKCVRFWFLIYGHFVLERELVSLRVEIRKTTNNESKRIFFTDETTHEWQFVQIPIRESHGSSQLDFIGVNTFGSVTVLAIDDVSFTKEKCERIPWKPTGESCGNFDFERGTLEGWTKSGDAFNYQPTLDDNILARTSGSEKDTSGHQGNWWLGTYENRSSSQSLPGSIQGDKPTGVLNSSLIRITGPGVEYLIGGGCGDDQAVSLLVDDIKVALLSKLSNCKEHMRHVKSNAFAPFIGRVARVQVADLSSSQGGHINFDHFTGDFVCLGEKPCDISKEWCGWKSLGGWKNVKYNQLNLYTPEAETRDHDSNLARGDPGSLSDTSNTYQLSLPNSSLGYISFSDISPLKVGFTLCFWIKTRFEGFFTEYKVVSNENEAIAFGVYCDQNSLEILLNEKKSKVSVGLTDDTWHHVCLSWEAYGGLVQIFKDGERKGQLIGFHKRSELGMEGGGIMTIGFRSTRDNASVGLGDVCGFNMWSYPLSGEEILRMSQGCGRESGDVKKWYTVKQGINKNVRIKSYRTCTDREGDRLVVDHNVTQTTKPAVLLSPLIYRSRDWYQKCLKFRYKLNGPGMKVLTIYQKLKNYRKIPIWSSGKDTGKLWKYGEVPLSSVSQFKVLIEGEVETNDDIISLAGLYIEDGAHCKHQPADAKYACNEILSNKSGYFFSPSFPGFDFQNLLCSWLITVPSGNKIRLEFLEFRLRDHPTCDNCYVQILDGSKETAPAIGKFCGFTYPPVFVSSTNKFAIILRCHGNLVTAKFKAYYHSIRAYNAESPSCFRQQGCPSGCKCSTLRSKNENRLLVAGKGLMSVPSSLSHNTGAVIFKRNRISQLREGDFYDLPSLKYIDMSLNILLHLDEAAFRNVSSVETLRLNSNFFRTLPKGGFQGLDHLRVLDLGKNLLDKAKRGMLVGISTLEVLSLRSNQITELEYGLFNKTGNLTFLYLQQNKIQTLPEGLFGALSKLKLLNLSNNELTRITKNTFRGLTSVEFLYLENNKLIDVPPDVFSDLKNLKYVKLDRFILCCYAQKSIAGVSCESPVDEFSSCDDLMKNKMIQICIWILGILALLGNLLVIIWRVLDREENRVHSLLLINLAAADLLMGVYLLTIAVMDLRWQGEYFKHDVAWRSGIGCQAVGVLSMLSSEVSVLILTIITLDRLICIVFPFKFKRLTYKSAVLVCAGIWSFGLLISLIPISGISYFYDESGQFGFYSRSAVCLPLQLSEGTPAGWQYSVSFFVGLNFISFTFILFAYIAMLWTVKRVSRAVRSTNLNKESAMAKRLVFIVMTDFCCWMPIIIINILSLSGNFKDSQKIAYVWIAVFVLPLNSSINPILYTFSTTRAKRSLDRRRRNINDVLLKTFYSNLPGRKQSLDWQTGNNKEVGSVASENLTNAAILNVVPKRGTRTNAARLEENRIVRHTKITVIEEPQILQDDITATTGYLVAWCEEDGHLSLVLLKYFAKHSKEDWIEERDIVKSVASKSETLSSVLNYRWHSKARDHSFDFGKTKIRAEKSTSLLICYDFVSSSTLENFLGEAGTVINFDTVCAIAVDIISTIEQLELLGICHNNITTKNILIGPCQRLPPIRAVLGGFSKASKRTEGAFSNWGCAEQSNYCSDIEQFGNLMAILLGHCHGSSEYIKLHEVMNMCFEEKAEKKQKTAHIRELLEDAWCTLGIWDTCL